MEKLNELLGLRISKTKDIKNNRKSTKGRNIQEIRDGKKSKFVKHVN